MTEPKQAVTYNINPKAIWYDGTPITWEDFHWQWRARNGSNKAYQISSSTGYSDIENVARGRDDREVIVTLKNKYADWQALFYGLYPASTNKSPEIFNSGWRARPLTTAGPFKLGSIDLTAKTVTLVRNEKWWGNPAKLESIVFRAIDADAQIDALANGEIDIMDIGPDVNNTTCQRHHGYRDPIAWGTELPALHHQRHRRHSPGPQGAAGAGDGDRSSGHCQGDARPARHRSNDARQSHLHA